MATRTRLTEEEREQRRERERELVKESVERLRGSEGWQSWLATRSRFRRYSLGNQLLIAIQSPTAGRVAGFKKWVELGYLVRTGEKAVKIWAPIPPSERRKQEAATAKLKGEDGPSLRMFFKLVPVFGDDQIEPLSLGKLEEYRARFRFGAQLRTLAQIEEFLAADKAPVMLKPPLAELEGDSLEAAYAPLLALAQEIDHTVEIKDTGRAGGYLQPDLKRIALSEKASVNQRIKTFVHELGHALIRVEPAPEQENQKLAYAQEELIVESVAMTVCSSLGLPTDDYSVGYLCSWSTSTDIGVIEDCAKLINRLADRLEAALPEDLFKVTA
jgi:antirestriction protein ArdC